MRPPPSEYVSARSIQTEGGDVLIPAAPDSFGAPSAGGGWEAPALPSTTEVLRPLIDLGGEGMSVASEYLALAAAGLVEPDPCPPPQAQSAKDLRRSLLAEEGLGEFDVLMPGELAESLRSDAWSQLVAMIRRWEALSPGLRLRVVVVLNKLSLYDAVARILPAPANPETLGDDTVAALELRRTIAMSKLGASAEATQRAVEEVASHGSLATRLKCAITLTVHHGRITKDTRTASYWATVADGLLDDVAPGRGPHDWLLRSIALRAICFRPMFEDRRHATWEMLDLAEEMSTAVRDSSAFPDVVTRENDYALTETRSTVAALYGERDDATELARRLVAIDPYETRSHRLLGDRLWSAGDIAAALVSYRTSAALGAPLTAVAWYSAGRCAEQLDDLPTALDMYKRSLAVDPCSVSSLLRARVLFERLGATATPEARWAEAQLSTFHAVARRQRAERRTVHPHENPEVPTGVGQ